MGSSKLWAIILILGGVLANNLVYLQDLWFGQGSISLDSWRAYAGLLVSVGLVLIGLVLANRAMAPKGGG
jgi:membrane protease YdiL (CAAX protease family)